MNITQALTHKIKQMVASHTLSNLTSDEINRLARHTSENLVPFIVELESEREYLEEKENEVKIYADGYGRWHAIVPDTPRALTKAVDAIANGMTQRENLSRTEAEKYIHRNITTVPADQPGTVHFIEYEIA